MTVPEVNNKSLYISITNILNDLYKNVYLICVGDKEHSYRLGELRAIDRLVVWIAQINYPQSEIEDQIAKFEDDAEYYLMGINGILKHQIYSAEYFGTTLLFSGFVAKGVAQFQRNMHPISITIITGRTNVGSILCR